MDHEFWLQRWREGRIGFHQLDVSPMLKKHWPALGVAQESRVFVPLAGKSNDMVWLAAQGYRVLGVELSALAVEQFMAEHDLVPTVHSSPQGTHYLAGPIELICGDVFELDPALLAECAAIYDRAALVALPADMRGPYAQQVYGKLPEGCRGLLIALEYPQQLRSGPPFSVPEREVRARLEPRWQVALLERTSLAVDEFAASTVYRLQHAGNV